MNTAPWTYRKLVFCSALFAQTKSKLDAKLGVIQGKIYKSLESRYFEENAQDMRALGDATTGAASEPRLAQ